MTELLDSIRVNTGRNGSDLLVDQIKDLIIREKLSPNYKFPGENDLCKQLGIGRSTLREAYKVLESNGFITRTKHGTFVNNREDIISKLPFCDTMEMADIEDLMEFRSMLEAELAGLAAVRADEKNVEKMQFYLNEMRGHQEDIASLTYFDVQFHMEIAAASGNQLFYNTMVMAKDVFSKGIYNAFQCETEENVCQALEYHQKILEAVRYKNSQAAKLYMRDHVQSVCRRVNGTNSIIQN